MREIKFRGLSYSAGNNKFKWVYGDLNQMQSEIVIHERAPMRTAYFVHEHTVGQYTGLPDEEGTEMYDGDIVEVDGERASIKRVPGGFLWAGIPMQEISNHGMKVIGNIYEYPELLEV